MRKARIMTLAPTDTPLSSSNRGQVRPELRGAALRVKGARHVRGVVGARTPVELPKRAILVPSGVLTCWSAPAPGTLSTMDAHAAEGSASLRHRHAADAEPEDRGEIDAGGEESTGRKRASSGQDASVAAKGHRTRAQRVAASVREARRLISPYLWRGVLPCAIILGVAAATSAAGYKNMWGVRLVLFLVAFVVVRDAMVPCKLWDIGGRGQFGRRFFWMRFVFNAPILLGLGLGGLAIPQVMNLIEPELAVHVVHFREHWIPSSLASMALGVLAAYPVLVANQRLGGVGPARVMDPVRTTNPKAIWFQPSTRASMIFFVVAGAWCGHRLAQRCRGRHG